MNYVVSSSSLNLRGAAVIDAANIIATLPQGQPVAVVDNTNAAWWKVNTTLAGKPLQGFAAAKYLQPAGQAAATAHTKVDAVNCEARADSNRASTDARYCPLGEPTLPRRDPAAAPSIKIPALHAIIAFLDVEHSARYQPTAKSTYCNIYAYDVCYLAGVYLPRVWWKSKALLALAQGTPQEVQYGTTVDELNANALHDWLGEWGDDFGWQRTFDATDLQTQINNAGGIGVICGRRKDITRSGHITVVLPERPGNAAQRSGAGVIAPLQSQAGVKNKQYFATPWWIDRAAEFSNVGFWWQA